MKQIKEALILNPDFIPQGKAVARLNKQARQVRAAAGAFVNEKGLAAKDLESGEKENALEAAKAKEEKAPEAMPKIDAKPLVVKKIRLKKLGISCGIVSLGETGPEVISQGNLIYINQDHPLYRKFYKRRDQFVLHLLRLITQEIVLMKKLRITAAEAFNWQGKLLKDAWLKDL